MTGIENIESLLIKGKISPVANVIDAVSFIYERLPAPYMWGRSRPRSLLCAEGN